jgi:hypothetical protein
MVLPGQTGGRRQPSVVLPETAISNYSIKRAAFLFPALDPTLPNPGPFATVLFPFQGRTAAAVRVRPKVEWPRPGFGFYP